MAAPKKQPAKGFRASLSEDAPSRRDILLSLPSMAAVAALSPALDGLLTAPAALAEAGVIPKGFSFRQDGIDRYAFLYPYGWQEVQVRGQDVAFKDVIEPLESVGVTVIKTERGSLKELGSAEEVSKVLMEKVLTSPSQKPKLVAAKEVEKNGHIHYDFEFVSQAPNFTRHALVSVVIANGLFITLTTGANERRWSKVEEKLRTVADSFTTI